MRITVRTIAGIGALVVLGGALAYAFRPQPVPVDLATIDRGPLAETVRDEAYTEVREAYVVSAPVSGQLLRVQVEVGDKVVAGETPLARIRPSDPGFLDVRSQSEAQAAARTAEANLALARAEVRGAEAQLEFARAEMRRADELSRRGTISPQALERRQLDLDNARTALATAQAAARARIAELEQARARLIDPTAGPDPAAGTVQVTAPVDGRILRLMQESEAVVAAGMALLELGDPADLRIVAELLSTDAVRLTEGADVRIYDWGGPQALAGRIDRIQPFGFRKISALGIEEQRVKVLIDFVEPPPTGLGHGYRVEIEAVVWADGDALRLPLAALFRDGDTWAVFVVDAEDKARLRRVEIGHMGETAAELRGGLEAGDRVVLHPDERIDDGIWIAPRQGS